MPADMFSNELARRKGQGSDGGLFNQFEAEIQRRQANEMEDMGRGAVSGLMSGVTGAADLALEASPASIFSRAAREFDPESKLSDSKAYSWFRSIFDQPMRKAADKLTGGASEYEPKTEPGKVAKTAAEFLPNVLSPGSAARKVASVVLPTVTTELAGRAAKDKKIKVFGSEYSLEPFAKAAGALGGGMATAGGITGSGLLKTARRAAKAAPNPQSLKAAADMLYGQMRQAGIRYDSNDWSQTIRQSYDRIFKKGYRPSAHPEVFSYLDELTKSAGMSPDFDDVERLSERMGEEIRDLYKQQKAGRAGALEMLRDDIDEFGVSAPFISSTPMSSGELRALRTAARETVLRQKKQRVLQELLDDAETKTGNYVQALDTGIGNLLRSKRGKQLFNDTERELLLDVQKGSKTLTSLAKFGIDPAQGMSLTNLAKGATMAGGGAFGTLANPAIGLPLAGAVGVGTFAKAALPGQKARAMDRVKRAMANQGLPSIARHQAQLDNRTRLRRYLAGTQAGRIIYQGETGDQNDE